MKRIEIASILGMAGALLISSISGTAFAVKHMEDSVLRLHIIANSDSSEDQLLKYRIRDAILADGAAYLSGSTPEEARLTAETSLQHIEEIARETAALNGCFDEITAEYVTMPFDARTYEVGSRTCTLPAGVYDAVRVNIGDAKGQNWWCVMYPPLCIPAAAEKAENQEKLFTEEEMEILSEPCKFQYKLKCVEWFEKVWNRLCE